MNANVQKRVNFLYLRKIDGNEGSMESEMYAHYEFDNKYSTRLGTRGGGDISTGVSG